MYIKLYTKYHNSSIERIEVWQRRVYGAKLRRRRKNHRCPLKFKTLKMKNSYENVVITQPIYFITTRIRNFLLRVESQRKKFERNIHNINFIIPLDILSA